MLHVFIINSFAGNGNHSYQIRQELESKNDLEYVVFNSEYPGHEGVLASQIYDLFPDDMIRFYACGGSGTLRNIMAGLPDFKRAQFAFVPCGSTNDFLKVFGKKKEQFRNLDQLIEGKVVNMDYIRTNAGCAMNTLSSGYDVTMVKTLNVISQLPFGVSRAGYAMASVFALFSRRHLRCHVEADYESIETIPDMIVLANGSVFGGSFHIGEGISPMDGKLSLIIIPKSNIFRKIRFVAAFLSSNYQFILKSCICREVKRVNIYPADETGFEGNYDGELVHSTHLEATVVPEGVRFVVPRDMSVQEALHGE